LAARKGAKSGKAPATTGGATTTTVGESKATETVETKGETVAVAVENEATDAKVNPPENADAPVVTVETIEAEKAAKVAEKAAKTPKGKKAATTAPTALQAEWVTQTSGGTLSRALDAFFDVIVDSLATRISEKMKK